MTQYPSKIMDIAVPQLRAQLSTSDYDDPFDNGSILRFTFKNYTVVALKVAERWYTTSSREAFMPKVLSYADLLEYMAYAPRSVAVAINWMKAVHAQ